MKAVLVVECFMMNPPQPIGIGVIIDGKPVGSVSLEDFDKINMQLSALRKIWEEREWKPKGGA